MKLLLCAMIVAAAVGAVARNTQAAIDSASPTARNTQAAIDSASPAARNTQAAIDSASPADWRRLNPSDTLYMDLPSGRVVLELASEFAPAHVANIRALVRQRWFDGTTVNRVQENYVTQWGDASGRKPLGRAKTKLAPEFSRAASGLAFAPIPGPDGYAPRVGFVNGFPTAVDANGTAWLTHCYAMVGVGRGDTVDSGSGAELYTVIGHAPRHLDRNITLVGRVVDGMEHLSALPRGTGPLGFYEQDQQRVSISRMRLAADVPADERIELEVMRTDSRAFAAYVDARAHRSRDGWFVHDAGFVDLCNIRVPVRPRKAP